MVEPLPKWAMSRYALLWQTFSESKFDHKDAVRVLKLPTATVSVTLNQLKKKGWLSAELDLEDTRKRHYVLTTPSAALSDMNK